LLELRLKDLKVTVNGTWLEACLASLHEELEERGIRARPHAWISSEWFSPENTPGIAIPFYLTHPRLMQLERKMIIDVEGGTWSECMSILRHEAGHVLQHSYQLQRRRRWQKLFGRSSQRYPRYYRPNPAAGILSNTCGSGTPRAIRMKISPNICRVASARSNWRSRYAGWPALKKLEYVDALMTEIAGQPPLLSGRDEVDPLNRLTETLGEHYRKKQALYAFDAPTTYDRDLLRLFSADPRHHRRSRLRCLSGAIVREFDDL